jgi:hypothetical protein
MTFFSQMLANKFMIIMKKWRLLKQKMMHGLNVLDKREWPGDVLQVESVYCTNGHGTS